MLIHQSEYVEIDLDTSTSIISYIYTPSADHSMTDEDFKANMCVYSQLTKQHKPSFLILDLRYLRFVISPTLQEWTATEIAPLTISLKRMAVVLGADIFAQVSIEQLMDEDGIADKYDKPRYFEDVESAKSWLLS